uniref:Uncharacterized protein n=1 Tax=Nitzschia sp. IriIs04 TaxID=1444690 RepID=A0A0S3QPL7_9STRA|nr:hypothetical protein [Nitzschia sp. IriIs04]YP_009193356.1 hypothetical protein [Nitzschia sp. IriIs04]BAT70249.1 hypothetical protein [Nitzschia sp. IriIs04]BAT70281.1 hypothetical protein [Nitzschia sp. IriIs04]
MCYKKKLRKINVDIYSPFNIIRISNKYVVASIYNLILAPFRVKLLNSLITQKKQLLSYEKMKFSRRLKFRFHDFFLKKLLKPNILDPLQNHLIKPIFSISKKILSQGFVQSIRSNFKLRIKKKIIIKICTFINNIKIKSINKLIKQIGFVIYIFVGLYYNNHFLIFIKRFFLDENINNLLIFRNNFENFFLYYYYKYLYVHSLFILINTLVKLLILIFIVLYRLTDFVALGQEWLCINVIFNQIRHKIFWGIASKFINNSIKFINLIKYMLLPMIFEKKNLTYINRKIFWKIQHIIYPLVDEIMMMTFDITILINISLKRVWSVFQYGSHLIINDIKLYSYYFGKQYGKIFWKRSRKDYFEIVLMLYLFIKDIFTLFLKITLRYSYIIKRSIFCIYRNIWYIYAIIRVYIHMILFLFSYFYLMLDIKTQFLLKKNYINKKD